MLEGMPQPFDRSYFDPIALDLFYCMVTERMRIYWRREEGAPPPWTMDPILRTEFITNVYRELDPGTQYVINDILVYEEESFEDKLLNVMMYRLMGSRETTHQHIGFQRVSEWDKSQVEADLKALRDGGGLPFGEAYRTAAYSDMGSKDKVENVVMLFDTIVKNLESNVAQIRNAVALREVFDVLNGIRGFGEFLAYQIMVDLLYPAPEEPLIPFTQEEWVMAGPGARRGIWRLMKEGMKPSSLLDVMVWLRDHQDEEFARLGLDFQAMKDADGNPVPISLCNIQSCLCEFFKYTRIWDGKSNWVRKYPYGVALVNPFNEPAVTFPRPPGGIEGVGDVVVGAVRPDLAGMSQNLGLASPAVAGAQLLQGVAGNETDEAPPTPQAPADYTGDLVDAGVLAADAVGSALQPYQVGREPLDSPDHLSGRAVNGLLVRHGSGSLGVAPGNQSTALDHYDARATQADVQPYEGETVHVVVKANRRIKQVHIEFD